MVTDVRKGIILLWLTGAGFLSAVDVGAGECEHEHLAASHPVGGFDQSMQLEHLVRTLSLEPAVVKQAREYLRLIEAMGSVPTDDQEVCHLVSLAQEMQRVIGGKLYQYWDAISEEERLAQGPSPRVKSVTEIVEYSDLLLPGIGFVFGAETIYHFVRYGELAAMREGASPANRLLEATDALWNKENGWPIFIEQQTDVTGCSRPGSLAEPLRRAWAIWGEAPECMKAILAPVYQQVIRTAVEATCFCDEPEDVAADLESLAIVFEQSPIPTGSSLAKFARNAAKRTDLIFECR